MIVRVINIYVKRGYEESFKDACRKNREGSVKESGILRFDVLEDSGNPLHFILYEVYKDEEATREHKNTNHYKAWREVVEPWMAKPRESVACNPVVPVDESDW
ncbi:MAG: antibiotic biosynthesis monooxygenase [Spirochaetes bacterium]|nr:MAG: antibiotic biosynthesis monooxygenase [Spirochaetota bacterium]